MWWTKIENFLNFHSNYKLNPSGCAIYHNWWPAFVIAFYITAPVPYTLAKRFGSDSYSSSK